MNARSKMKSEARSDRSPRAEFCWISRFGETVQRLSGRDHEPSMHSVISQVDSVVVFAAHSFNAREEASS
jgi:hypothetical protein